MAQLCLWPKSAPSSDSFWVHRLFNVCVRVFCVPNAIILLTKIKMSFIWKDDFFFAKIGIFCISPWPLSGRIKLIIYLIRHELSGNINEISSSWKKTLDGGPNIYLLYKYIFKGAGIICTEIRKHSLNISTSFSQDFIRIWFSSEENIP